MDSLADDGWLRSLAVYIKWGDVNDVTNSDDRLTIRQYADAVFLFESCTEVDLGNWAVEPVTGSVDADHEWLSSANFDLVDIGITGSGAVNGAGLAR